MSEPSVDPSLITWLVEHLWVPVIGGIGLLGKSAVSMVIGRIEKVEQKQESSVSKDDFREYADRAETSRKEMREAVVGLYKAVDEVKTLIITKQ